MHKEGAHNAGKAKTRSPSRLLGLSWSSMFDNACMEI